MKLESLTTALLLVVSPQVPGQTYRAGPLLQDVSQRPAENALRHDTLVVPFHEGSARLSDRMRRQLTQLVSKDRATGILYNVYVGVWSDKPFPSNPTDSLPAADQELAHARAKALHDFLVRELHLPQVFIYNMARGTNLTAEVLKTEDAEAKRYVAGAKVAVGPDNREEIVKFRQYGKPSRAVVVVEVLPRSVTH